MNRPAKIGLTAAALMVSAEMASADTITQTLTFGPATTPWTHTFSFVGFDTALGTLTQVSDTLTEHLAGTVDVVNNGSAPTFFVGLLTNTASKSLPGLSISLANTSNAVFGALAPGESSGSMLLAGVSSSSAAIISGLSSYEVASVLANAMDTSTPVFASSTGNAAATFTHTGEITDQLVYTLTPLAPIPEPGTLAILSSSLAGLFFICRRRRNRKRIDAFRPSTDGAAGS